MSEPIIGGLDPEALDDFESEGYSNEDALELASGLLYAAIPCLASIESTLTPAQSKIAKFAVLEMAKYIKIEFSAFDSALSPFQSETIGSWSYSKAASAVSAQQSTGVPGFDRAVELLGGLCSADGGSVASVTSEQVFKPGFEFYERKRMEQSGVIPRPYPPTYVVYPWRD